MAAGSGATPGGALRRVELARRRGELALAAADGKEETVRAALGDDEPALRAGALRALVTLGGAQPGDLAAALADPDPLVRRAACELGSALPPGCAPAVVALLDGEVAAVVEAAAYALGELGDRAATPALCKVAGRHADPLCREAAVAALGAIGDERALTVVLDCLAGPPALRRRSVVALAAFDGPQVEGALRRALADRDWQVRECAAAVLGVQEKAAGGPDVSDAERR